MLEPEYEFSTEYRPIGTGLTKEELNTIHAEGWEEYIPSQAEAADFPAPKDKAFPIPTAGFVFRRLKR